MQKVITRIVNVNTVLDFEKAVNALIEKGEWRLVSMTVTPLGIVPPNVDPLLGNKRDVNETGAMAFAAATFENREKAMESMQKQLAEVLSKTAAGTPPPYGTVGGGGMMPQMGPGHGGNHGGVPPHLRQTTAQQPPASHLQGPPFSCQP